jgi:plastocyanin
MTRRRWVDAVGRYCGFVPRLSAGLLVIGLLASILTGCSDTEPGSDPASENTIATAKPGHGGVQEVLVTGDEHMRFTPAVIQAKPGMLRITLKNSAGTPHDLEVRPLNANTGIVQKGEQKSIEVRLDRGSYDFVCTFHTASNMVGTITVA